MNAVCIHLHSASFSLQMICTGKKWNWWLWPIWGTNRDWPLGAEPRIRLQVKPGLFGENFLSRQTFTFYPGKVKTTRKVEQQSTHSTTISLTTKTMRNIRMHTMIIKLGPTMTHLIFHWSLMKQDLGSHLLLMIQQNMLMTQQNLLMIQQNMNMNKSES